MGPAQTRNWAANWYRQFNDTIVCTGNSNCNPAIAPIGVGAAPPCIMNQKLEMGPKSETWTRKLIQVEQLHRAILLFALSRPVMAAFAKHTGDGQLPSIQICGCFRAILNCGS
jgi:hypothetical protein